MGRATSTLAHLLRLTLFLAAFVTHFLTGQTQPSSSGTIVAQTNRDARHLQQAAAAERQGIVHNFGFTDQWSESGIRFQHHVVDDAGKHYKAVHYDHGNGLAVGDVDGDGAFDIYFCNQVGGNQLWRNLGNGKFEDITARAGVGLTNRVSVSAAFGDIDNDGDCDLFVTTVRMENVLYENLGNGAFKDISQRAGVNYSGHSSGAQFFDFDRDGLLDLYVANIGVYTTDVRGAHGYYVAHKDAFAGHLKPERDEPGLLYQNLGGGRFREVSRELNLVDHGWGGDASICDVNADGWPDLYVLNMQGDNHLYINIQGKSFAEQTSRYFPKTSWGAMGVKFFDFNQDGLLDLFVTDMHSDMSDPQTKLSVANSSPAFEKRKSETWCRAQFTDSYLQGASNNIFGNSFYLNTGQGKFREVSDTIGAETFWPWGLSVGDLNADGFEDAFITAGMGFGFRYAINSVLLNDKGRAFLDAEFLLGVEPRLGGRTEKTAFTLDCSGADREHPLCANRSGSVPFSEALSSRSSAMFDLDNDGDLDIVTNEMNDRPQVLVSSLAKPDTIHFVKLKLSGRKSNRDGLGSVIRVRAGGRDYLQYHDGKSGYLSQSALPCYFGLGNAKRVDRIDILWPAGTRQSVTNNIRVNDVMVIVEAAP